MSSSESSYSNEDEGGPQDLQWDDWEDGAEEEMEPTRSLFEPSRVFPSPSACIEHDAAQHGFNLRTYKTDRKLEEYDVIRLVNYIRGEVKEGRDPRATLAAVPAGSGAGAAAPWSDDRYLIPVLAGDPLMFFEFEEEEEEAAAAGAAGSGQASAAEAAALRAENEALRTALRELSAATLPAELLEDFARGAAITGLVPAQAGDGPGPSSPGTSSPSSGASTPRRSRGERSDKRRVDEAYFDSYSQLGIHRDMLGDRVRTEAYRDALEGNPSLIKGSVVLDVGCGTGILSMFAARGGAAHVIGVDGSAKMAALTRANADANGFPAGTLDVAHGRVESLESLPGARTQVDVIVSEWMGYALLFETMLPTVINARDRWLKPGGAVLPDIAKIIVAPANEAAGDLAFWNDVYGFKMPALRDAARDRLLRRPMVRSVLPGEIVGPSVEVKSFDLTTMKAEDQDFSTSFELRTDGGAEVHSVVLWFDCEFSARFCKERAVVLPTSPHGTQTHWAQTVLSLREPVRLEKDDRLACRLSFAMAGKHRALDLSLEAGVVRGGAAAPEGGAQPQVMAYRMEVEADE